MAAVGCLHRIALSRSASDRRPVAQPLIRKVSWAVCPATGLTGQTVAGMRCASDGGQRGVGGWRRQHDGRLLRDCRACAAGPAGDEQYPDRVADIACGQRVAAPGGAGDIGCIGARAVAVLPLVDVGGGTVRPAASTGL